MRSHFVFWFVPRTAVKQMRSALMCRFSREKCKDAGCCLGMLPLERANSLLDRGQFWDRLPPGREHGSLLCNASSGSRFLHGQLYAG